MASGNFWVTEPDQKVPIRLGTSGRAANPPVTSIQVLKNTVTKHGNEKALGLKRAVNVSVAHGMYVGLEYLMRMKMDTSRAKYRRPGRSGLGTTTTVIAICLPRP
ncbi:hypothetical protein EON64_18860 [archaeon]|nr:MAG: hypothetical protein EON64_18860 [archaeon]